METCSNCGKVRNSDEKFCVDCGQRLDVISRQENIESTMKARNNVLSARKKKKRIFLLVTLIALILAAIGTHLYLKSQYDVVKSIANMNQAYSASNKEEFLNYFNIPEDAVVNSDGFYSYIEEEGWENLREKMKEESQRLEIEGVSNIISDSNGNKLIAVLSEPVFGGLYNKVSFLIQPVEVTVEMPFDETQVTIENLEVTANQGDVVQVGKFVPGTYTWNGKVKSDYAKIEESDEVAIVGDGKNKFKYSPAIDATMVEITSDLPEAVLWVNGKSIEKTIKEVKTIGPIPLDGSIEITAEGKDDSGKKVKGEPLALEKDSVHIKFAHVQEKVAAEKTKKLEEKKLRELEDQHAAEVAYFIDSFRDSFESALNYQDFSYIAEYFPTGSKVQNDYLADIERHQAMNDYYTYDFQSNTVTNFSVVGENTFLLTTAEMFYFSSTQDDLRYNKTKNYTVIYQNGRYYIQAIDQLTSEKTSV